MQALKRWLLMAVLGVAAVGTHAQDNAQICVRLYEDRAESGTLDAGDPFITKDVGINLANAEGVIIRTALIDDAPQGSSGRVCFTQLAQGQYTVSVVSAAYTPTTDSVFVTSVGGSAVPLVFDVGMQRLLIETRLPAPAPGELSPEQARFALERVFVAGIASSIVVAIMLGIGAVIYVLFLRQKPQPAMPARNPYAPPPQMMRPDTGTMPPIPPIPGPAPARPITDSLPPVPPIEEDDTGSSPTAT